jgi:RNA-directed DNA polymerase
MAQPQAITYQYDLFSEQRQDVIRPFPTSETVCGASGTKAFQVKEAGEQERALTPDLMSLVLSHDNIKAAYKQVKRNKGVAGIDQMPTGDFAEWYSQNAETLQSELYNGAYQPQGVKQVEIPKPNGANLEISRLRLHPTCWTIWSALTWRQKPQGRCGSQYLFHPMLLPEIIEAK